MIPLTNPDKKSIENIVNQKFDPISKKIDNISLEIKLQKSEIPPEIYEKIILSAIDTRKYWCGQIGSCFVSSRKIGFILNKHEINYDIVKGRFLCGLSPPKNPRKYHVWIEFPQYNNTILDISADQFGIFPTIWFPADKKCYKKK